MAYQYKLVKELGPNTLSKIGKFVTDNPKVEYIRKEFVKVPANTDESERLDFVLRGTLEKRGGFTPSDIEEYMDFLYTERNNNVGGEWGDTPLNELTPKAGFATPKEDDFMGIASKMAQKGNNDRNTKQEKSNRKLGNTPMTDKERNMTPEEYREYREREKLEELKERVISKLKEGKPCWKGYEQIGMKEKNGKQVPNCVPKKR
jgi:hypothetical protein